MRSAEKQAFAPGVASTDLPVRDRGRIPGVPMGNLRDLEPICRSTFYPGGATLFAEQERPRGLFMVLSGQAKLSANSRKGRSVILRLVGPGGLLGISSVVANVPYIGTAETVTPSEIGFIPGLEFLRQFRMRLGFSSWVAQELSAELHKAWEQTCSLALTPDPKARFIGLLLAWAREHGRPTEEGVHVPFSLSREEIGESIGASRETVSRVVAYLKRRRMIRILRGSILLVQLRRLRALAEA